ncbi:agamous-like MADS-box protein AGL80 [Impatiens glandulifera]|uniref:agamous-like MADS-box protein AGL80 n=1 Tax=Impatiens glandulifera TaxID=253017 RepID=UPI001FB0FE57|nr:agamous-like MADS-box protein AGL80 [Impatiens glandulifera]
MTTRRKMQLSFIANNIARKATFRKRKGGLVKKMHEITTLCGIEGCVIINDKSDPQPTVWPSEEGARKTIERFRSLPIDEQNKGTVNQESFTKQRLEKMEEKVKKLRGENREKEVTLKMYESMCGDPLVVSSTLNANECEEVINMLSRHIMEMDIAMETVRNRNEASSSNPLP